MAEDRTGAPESPATPATAVPRRGEVRLRELSVEVAGRRLLEGVEADFRPGEVALIVGASGAGKTVLMRVISGLHDPEVIRTRGRVEVQGPRIARELPRERSRDVGIVFQDLALFEELSPRANLRFALDHRHPGARHPGALSRGPDGERVSKRREVRARLDEFQLPSSTPVRSLSGGQQQRLALARTLAYDPPVVIFDEPTTGLDPVNARRVAERIRETARAHGKTTIVVTHDYEHLAEIADAIWLIDPREQTLRRLEPNQLAELSRDLPGAGAEEVAASERARPRRRPLEALGRASVRTLELSGMSLECALSSLLALLPRWRSPRWGLRFFLHYLWLLASPSAWLYFAFAGLIAGFVGTYFTFKFLPQKNITDPLIADELLNALGMIQYRVVVPVLTTVLLAARSGAAVASDIGSRSLNRQLDSLRSFGARPPVYLLTPILWSFLVVTPLLVGAAFLAARWTSLAVFLYNEPAKGAYFWESHFHSELRVPGQLLYDGTWWLLAKVSLCGFGTGAIAYQIAAGSKNSGVEVSRAVTTTIIWATLFVLVVHFGFSFLEFEVAS